MKHPLVAAGVGAFSLGFVLLVWGGLMGSSMGLGVVGAGGLFLAGVGCFFIGAWKAKPVWFMLGMLGVLGVSVLHPVRVDGLVGVVVGTVAYACVISGTFLVLFSLRTGVGSGPVSRYGLVRIVSTVGVAGILVLFVVQGSRLLFRFISVRTGVSLDMGSGGFLSVVSLVVLMALTGVSLGLLSRVLRVEGEGRESEEKDVG